MVVPAQKEALFTQFQAPAHGRRIVMLTYNMDVEPGSIWHRTTPGQAALLQPYVVTEAGLFYGKKNFSTARANKESYLIFYTISGCGWVKQGESQVFLRPGDALLLNCRTPQSYGTFSDQQEPSEHLNSSRHQEPSWHHYWIHTDGAGVKAMEPYLIPGGKLCPIHIPRSTRDIFESMLGKLPEETTESVLSTGVYVHRILNRMVRSMLSEEKDLGTDHQKTMNQIAEYIRLHYTDDIAMTDLLARSNMSRSYFLRLFRQYMGTTPYNFLTNYRITQARELLDMTDLPVAEIAVRVGFNDESNFSTRFSKITGQSPLQYRKSAITQTGI